MRALVGVDTSGSHLNSLKLLLRLGFSDLEIHLVHCIQSLMPDGSFPEKAAGTHLADLYKPLEESGLKAIEETAELIAPHGVKCTTKIEWGQPARTLIEYADMHHCDLIVVACTTKGYYSSLFFGSVAKGLVTGAKQSLLITKNEHAPSGKVDAVVATDHSPYMDRCLAWLENAKPSGFNHLTTLAAYDSSLVEAIVAYDPDSAAEVSIEHTTEATVQVASRLAPLAQQTAGIVKSMPVDQAIRSAMDESKSELLIMGAQGHGFFERLMIGSKSFHQVVAEPHSILVVRPAIS